LAYEKDFAEKEILIINNDQTEEQGIKELADRYPVQIITSLGNIGFAAAANQAARQATGQVLFFVNPDTKWHQSVLPTIHSHFADQQLGVLGIGLCSQEHVFEQGNGGSFLSWSNLIQVKRRDDRENGLVREVDWVSGGSLAASRQVYVATHGFDEQFFMYFEDMDFCKRVKTSGYSVILDQSVSLIHFGGKSHTSKKSQKHIYDTSLYLYVHKHWPLVARVPFALLHKIYRLLYPYGR
jgi:GT2 family glycosyltransferase